MQKNINMETRIQQLVKTPIQEGHEQKEEPEQELNPVI